MPGKKRSKVHHRKPETFSVHPLSFEQAIGAALKADPNKVKARMADDLKRRKKRP